MKIAIVTLANETVRAIGDLTAPNKTAYAKRHGYSLIVHNESLNHDRAPAWSKILAVQRALPDYDAVCWLDADIAIMEMERPLEYFLEEWCEFVAGGEASTALNSGAFIIRNTPATRKFLQDVWELPDKEAQYAHHARIDAGNWEQDCIKFLLEMDRHRVRYNLNGFAMCSPYWQSGNRFLLHPNGSQNQRKFEYLEEALHPHETFFGKGFDNQVRDMFGSLKMRFTEFCEGDGRNGLAMKLARSGWSGDLIGVDVAQSDLLLKTFWGFNSIRTHGCPQAGTFSLVSIQRPVSAEQFNYVMPADVVVARKPFGVLPGYRVVIDADPCVVMKRQ